MMKWEVAKYFIYAKKDIDSIMFINENLLKILLYVAKPKS